MYGLVRIQVRILIITDEVWNDKIHGNNILTNWFEGFNAEFANIYCSPGQPLNNCCKVYFQVTDKMMLKSFFGGKRAGIELLMDNLQGNNHVIDVEQEDKRLYTFLKSITTESMRALREFLWFYGKYDEDKLKQFIEKFNPDIIFSPRKASLKILRLERIIKKIANKPMVVFTGDDEYSLHQLRFSPVYWILRLKVRKELKKNMSLYSLYYTHSKEQGEIYNKKFNIKTKTLFKCSNFSKIIENKTVNKPIKLVYAGKLYCNRWKSLAEIAKALKKINQYETKMILEIYTKDKLSKKQKRLLDDRKNSFVKGPVSADDLVDIYKNSDIALHVESLDIKNRLLTKFSFSTKIIDCLASGCAVMAICWDQHTGYLYLKEKDAALCINNYHEISKTLQRICDNPDLINEYSMKAVKCGLLNHKKDVVQQNIYNDFTEIINSFNYN